MIRSFFSVQSLLCGRLTRRVCSYSPTFVTLLSRHLLSDGLYLLASFAGFFSLWKLPLSAGSENSLRLHFSVPRLCGFLGWHLWLGGKLCFSSICFKRWYDRHLWVVSSVYYSVILIILQNFVNIYFFPAYPMNIFKYVASGILWNRGWSIGLRCVVFW